jgi:tetratricopeptide (TPR) repeat protein
VERAQAALEVLGADPPDLEIGQLHWVLGRSFSLLGRYDEGIMAMERTLSIAEALRLPELLAQGLNGKATMYVNTARIEEARLLLAGAAEIARQHGRTAQLGRAEGNLGNVAMEWDLPEAGDRLESSREISLRVGDRYGASIATGNLMLVHLFRGRWEEAIRLAADTVAATDRDNLEDVHQRLVLLHALRGELAEARASLGHLDAWEHTDEREAFALFRSARLWLQLAEGDTEAALEQGTQVVRWTIDNLAASNENMRIAWPATMDAAFRVGRLDAARDLLGVLEERPPGHIPPYLNAQLARGRALLAAAEGRHDAVEADLIRTANLMRDFDYPYWLAVSQLDLAEWLIGQARRAEVDSLLEEAVEILGPLGAVPALARAQSLAEASPAGSVAVS